MSTLGERLRNMRTYHGLTQTEVSQRTGLNNKNLSNWENGVAKPSIDDLVLLSNIYETSVDSLLGRVAEPVTALNPAKLSPAEMKYIVQKCTRRKDEDEDKRLVTAYHRASAQIQEIVDFCLSPYMYD